ncbi:MAG: hypothetical protein HPY66_0009 [Firmicutes bacterium]|nr:hypothetical protein [Bacillota bacterium]
MFTPVKSKKMYVLAADQIKGLIEEGRLKAGEQLPSERDLAIQLGVSRSTVREAMTALEIQGLIEVRSGLGTFICEQPDKGSPVLVLDDIDEGTSPFEVFEARMIIEPVLARLAAQRATKEVLDDMRRNVDACEMINDFDYEAFERLDEEFHLIIARAANNEALYKFEESINSKRMGRLWGSLKLKSLQKEGRIKKYKNEHREILETITERNQGKAEHLVRMHLKDIKRHIFGD